MRSAFVRSIRWTVIFFSICCSLVFVCGWILHLTVRDTYRSIALLFYVTPLVILCGQGALASIGWLMLGKRRLAKCFAIATTASIVLLAFYTFRLGPTPISHSDGLRILYWNTAGGQMGWDGVLKSIESENPDIIAAVEGGLNHQIWKVMFPNYEQTDISGQIVLLSRLPIQQIGTCRITDSGIFKRICVTYDDQPLQIVAVDIASNPFANRREIFERLADHIESWNDQPLLVVGDFNTTNDSVHVQRLSKYLQNAFDTAGKGYTATWPLPVPLIQIDYAWHNHLVEVNSCRYGWNPYSDHRPILLNISRSMITPEESDKSNQSLLIETSTHTRR